MRALTHWKQRAVLALLLIVAGTVELRFAWTTLRYIDSPGSFPQDPARVDPESFRFSNTEAFARKAGMRDGDVLLAIDGAPVRSLIEAGRTYYSRAPGARTTFRLRRGTGAPFDVALTIEGRKEDDWQSYIIPPVVNILTPLCCTILGFLMAKLNVLVYEATPTNRFATFFYGLYEPSTRRLRYSTAGHNPALLQRASSGEIHWLKTRGVGLGLQRSSSYEQAELTLEPGDALVLYTDGVTEERNPAGEEFGADRLAGTVRGCMALSASGILEQVIAATTEFAGEAPQFDDITLIVARVL